MCVATVATSSVMVNPMSIGAGSNVAVNRAGDAMLIEKCAGSAQDDDGV